MLYLHITWSVTWASSEVLSRVLRARQWSVRPASSSPGVTNRLDTVRRPSPDTWQHSTKFVLSVPSLISPLHEDRSVLWQLVLSQDWSVLPLPASLRTDYSPPTQVISENRYVLLLNVLCRRMRPLTNKIWSQIYPLATCFIEVLICSPTTSFSVDRYFPWNGFLDSLKI